MVDQHGHQIVVTLPFKFKCEHEVELPVDNMLMHTECPICAQHDDRAEQEEVIRRMGLGIQ